MQSSIGIGATIAIIEEGKVLLTKREDFEVWCLPGGQVDPGESMADAAVREAREETGLEVELTRLVCLSSRSGGGSDVHMPIFAARVAGGTLSPQVDEVIDIGYFSADELPDDLMPWHRQPALDALAACPARSTPRPSEHRCRCSHARNSTPCAMRPASRGWISSNRLSQRGTPWRSDASCRRSSVFRD